MGSGVTCAGKSRPLHSPLKLALDNVAASNKDLVKVHVDLPNHWATGGESLWATPLGNDQYRLENVPFFAYGLNFHDVVLATPDSDDTIPEVRAVISQSGHRTLRVIFSKSVERETQAQLLDTLKAYDASYERATKNTVAIDIDPEGDYLATYDKLEEFADRDLLGFETCESREEGSFDDAAEDGD